MAGLHRLRRLLTAFPVLAALMFSSLTPARAEEPLVQLVRGSSYLIVEDSDSIQLRLPIIMRQGVSTTDVTAETVDVALGQLEQGGLAEAFMPTIQGSSGGAGPALVLTIKAARGLRPGTYDVILLLRLPHTGSAPEEERINIQIAHPAAILDSPPTLIIERTLPFFSFGALETEPVSVQLRETSRQSRVSRMTITQVNAAKTGDETVGGHLLFDRPATVDPGSVTIESFSLSGDFPVGITTGSVLVDAAQLQTPVSVNFEVRTRRSTAWIFFVAAAGLLIGVLARTWLKTVIALQDARVQAGDVLQTVNRELARRPDSQFQQAAGELRTSLEQAIQGNDPKAISDNTDRANKGLQDAIAALIDRRNVEQNAINALSADLRTPWMIPPSMSTAVGKANGALANAAAKLARDDVSGAAAQRVDITSNLLKELKQAANEWATGLSPILGFLAKPAPPLKLDPDPATVANRASSMLEAAPFSDPKAQPHDVLSAANDAQAAVGRVVQEIPVRLLSLARDVDLTLQGAGPRDNRSLASLSAAIESLAALLPSVSVQPDLKTSQELSAAVQTVLGKLGDAISGQIAGFSDDERKPIQELVAQGMYSEAATATAQLLRKPTERAYGPTDAEQPAATAAPPMLPFAPLGIAPGVADAAMPLLVAESAPPALTLRLQKDRRSLFFSQLLQSFLLGIVLLVIGYVLYSPHFIGTAADLAAIFLWAFAIDITVDAVLTAAKGATSTRSGVGVNP